MYNVSLRVVFLKMEIRREERERELKDETLLK